MLNVKGLSYIFYLLLFVLSLSVAIVTLQGCGSDPKADIKKLGGNKEEQDKAMLRLVLSKSYSIPPLIEALSNEKMPPNVRRAVVEVLYRLALREHDLRILPALLQHADDKDSEVRKAIVRAFGYMKAEEATDVLMDRLNDKDSQVKYQALLALDRVREWDVRQRVEGGEYMTEQQRKRLSDMTKVLAKDNDERISVEAVEFVERIASQITQEGDKSALNADLEGAEQKYHEALELAPNSKNVNHVLAMFYIDNGDKEKGLEILRKHGLLTYAKRFSSPPIIDGYLTDPCWKDAQHLTEFYNVTRLAAVPVKGKSEAFVGYTDDKIYIGVRGYEESMKNLVLKYKDRDKGRV